MLRKLSGRSRWFLTAILAAASLAAYASAHAQTAAPTAPPAAKVSTFGKYSGYSEPVYDAEGSRSSARGEQDRTVSHRI